MSPAVTALVRLAQLSPELIRAHIETLDAIDYALAVLHAPRGSEVQA